MTASTVQAPTTAAPTRSHIYDPLEHAAWNGWTPTDLIFPFFLFIVGVDSDGVGPGGPSGRTGRKPEAPEGYNNAMTRRLLPAALVSAALLLLWYRAPGDPVAGLRGSGADAAQAVGPDALSLDSLRHEMVRRQIEKRGIVDPAVLEAMRTVLRHRFVPGGPAAAAYTDQPLPIGHSQTISQPYIVAYMAEAADIEPGDRVLEIGTGSGYGAAVLAELDAEVYTIEIVPELAEQARQALRLTGYDDVHVRTGNGWLGWPEHAPYDAVVVTAAPDEVPRALVDQLALDGKLVIPVGERIQTLRVLRKTSGGLEEEASLPVRFVPMVGEPPDTAR